MSVRARVSSQAWLAVVLVCVLLAGQRIGDVLAKTTTDPTGRTLGRAGFAYVTGLRTFAAAVLWNRIEPLFHEYYEGKPLADQEEFIPTMALVIALDPEFEQAYYVSSWVLARRGLVEEGVDIARRGVESNPDSGLLRTGYSQLLFFDVGDLPGAVEQADAALASATWHDAIEQHDAYAYFRALYKAAGQPDRARYLLSEIERLDEEIGERLPAGMHDHDGDGRPDH